MDRRDFLTAGAAGFAAATMIGGMPGVLGAHDHGGVAPGINKRGLAALFPGSVDAEGNYTLPTLKYDYDAVDVAIDALTMELHHMRHHQAQVNGLIAAEANLRRIAEGDESLAPYTFHFGREAAFNGAGHFLHTVFWDSIGPDGMGEPPTGALAEAITRDFGGFEQMMRLFNNASRQIEGSGWAILAYSLAANKLVILQAQNHQLLTTWSVVPLMVNDVWEHAFYLRYNNRRADYVAAFPQVINWRRVGERFDLVSNIGA